MGSKVETYEDLSATVTYERGAAHVDFSVFEIIGHEKGLSGEFDVPMYEGIGGCGADEKSTTEIEKANRLLHGMIKWDGCSHVYFGDAENSGYIHMCGSNSFKNLSALLIRVYQRCYEIGEFYYDKLETTNSNAPQPKAAQ